MTTTTILTAARTEALFASDMPTGTLADRAEVQRAIQASVRANGGVRACLAHVGTEYGDHPETAVPRMAWARSIVDDFYPVRGPAARQEARR